ncbi:Rv3235 family protein [Streptomyces sp. NPDC014986]|uniref:Rv3235 family protein n=1 Tax=Streptomyces sp. NPDC014986 TaxID=3364934 RepID=UPI0036FA06CF
MHKVMTRAQHRPGTRPPARHDPRRPGAAAPPRTPAGRPAPAPAPAGGHPTTRQPAPRPTAAGGPAPVLGTAGGTAPGLLRQGGRPSPAAPRVGTTPPRVPTGGTAPALPAGGGRRPGTAAGSTGPADNRPASRTARGRGPAAHPAPSSRSAPAPVPRPDRYARRPVVPQPRPTDRFAELLLAVLSGQRPVHAMLRHTAGRAYDELVHLAESGPLRTRGARPVVRDIGWFEPREGAIEAFARIGAGDRLRAMAFRLEQGRDLRWRCTAVELGGPRPHRANAR